MPEHVARGGFVEEVGVHSKPIEGVPTSTAGFVGLAGYGPVQYPGGPSATEPRLVTSHAEFERIYGKLDRLQISGGERLPYLALAARAFFLNGGRRLYVVRVFSPGAGNGVAGVDIAIPGRSSAAWRARWPGRMGRVAVTVEALRGGDVGDHAAAAARADLVQDGAVVEVVAASAAVSRRDTPIAPGDLRIVRIDSVQDQTFLRADGSVAAPEVSDRLLPIELTVTVQVDRERIDVSTRLGLDPKHGRYVGRVFAKDDPEDEDSVVWFDYDYDFDAAGADAISLLEGLVGTEGAPISVARLDGGDDGSPPGPEGYGGEAADPDNAELKPTGLEALAEVDEIAIVALPDAGGLENGDERVEVTRRFVGHAETCRYRIAVLDGPVGASVDRILAFRGNFDSAWAALYHPWIEILDPSQSLSAGARPEKLLIPPSGFVAGIYARSDTTRGVSKAPVNEEVHGMSRLESEIDQSGNEVLNREHVNPLRFFPGRGNLVWGARALSSDPEWRYVNVRRLLIYLEHSIDQATRWAVFEPNDESLWRDITRTVEDFLVGQWRSGALVGNSPAQSYFVRCDRTTMTQSDLDNGRLICLVGVAPTTPAEFVIFRIGQWTADAQK